MKTEEHPKLCVWSRWKLNNRLSTVHTFSVHQVFINIIVIIYMQLTSLMMSKHHWLLNKEYVTNVWWAFRSKQCDYTANDSKFMMCKTLCIFSGTPCSYSAVYRMTTCMENLKISRILTYYVSKMSGILLKVREVSGGNLSGKSGLKLYW